MASVARTTQFLDSLGVNVHLEYTDGGYAKYTDVINDLKYLGISRVREGTPDPKGGIPYLDYLTALNAAASAGIKFDFVVGTGQSIATSLGQMDKLVAAHPGAVIAVEGPNEINNFPVSYKGLSGDAAARAFQKDLYAAVKADKNLAGASVYYYTGGNKATTIAGMADAANTHPYPNWGDQPYARFQEEFATDFALGGTYAKVSTETGYHDQPSADPPVGVDSTTQAKGTLNILMDGFAQGYSVTYLYQLLSAYPDPSGDDIDTEYGLFRQDNMPKPAAVAVHNLTTILADNAANARTFNPTALNFKLSGLPSDGHSVLLQKASGAYDLIVWAEPIFWDVETLSPVSNPSVPVTADLPAHQTVKLYDPLLGTTPISTLTDVAHAYFNVTDHPLIAEITPATINGLRPELGPTFNYGSPGNLEIFLSTNSTAKADVAVDGNQVFAGQNVTSLHSAGFTESFLITGPFGQGHDIAVTLHGGGQTLFLDGATVNGVLLSGVSHTFASNETYHFKS